jgi:Xaa-Pro aminopeptidase
MSFQSFTTLSRPEDGPPRLARLRAALAGAGLAGFIVPRADAHQGEYVAPRDARLAWLTGFTGSAGFAIVLGDVAGVFTDGRYRVQVRAQVDPAAFTPVDWPEVKPADWLREHLRGGGAVGFDPWLHTAEEIDRLETALAGSGIRLKPVANPIDAIWPDQPAPPKGAVHLHPTKLAGLSASLKIAEVAAALSEDGQKYAVLTLPDSICWMLNIRGADIPHNPVVHAFAIVTDEAWVTLFIDPEKLDAVARAYLGKETTLKPPEAFLPALAALSGPVRVDRATAPIAVHRALTEAGVATEWGADPCILPKARKNAAELAGARAAHLRDGAAMVEFLAWFDAEAPEGELTEIDMVRKLETCRVATGTLRDISFETIAGAGPHGAIVHYRVTEDSNRPITPGDIVLIDSGGQYADGTTDITRTLATGPVPDEARAAATRVLQGMIAISTARWPVGLAGSHLDALARAALWRSGQDYDHGTGHGVGAYLSVHEGPQRLSRLSNVALEPGMILSNEPGYYREGAFGIRIENLVAVAKAPSLPGGDPAREMLCFETLTHVPIDRRLIDLDMLSRDEIAWIDSYHARVWALVGDLLSPGAREWLQDACAPL